MPSTLKPALEPSVALATPSSDRYHTAVITLHWLILAVIAVVYTFIEIKGYFPKGSDARTVVKQWHEFFGLTIFGLVILRLIVRRIYDQTPRIIPDPPAWQHTLARVMHVLLYAFLVAMPLLGWLTLSAKGQLDLPMGLHLVSLIGPDKQLGRTIQDIHETIGNIGLYLIGLHAAAALFHHYWMRDNTLRRMLPQRWADKI
ncbi:MAG TPA: cytochrome b [Castellaniella sp.]|uniref:cytochrome b n=1 Tax=Castellaniella sp. TaxID=1955812 RepID=UPI002EE69D65